MQTPAPPKVYSLSQVASSIRKALEKATGNQSWLIRAEILKISEGLGQKTVYVDLVEESEGDQKAKMRGVIWASNGARIIETLGADASQILACGSEVVFSAQI
ncbi:MAG: exodeoxyribonuclease VII large subunit, partial [Flavobacteriales bacterium]